MIALSEDSETNRRTETANDIGNRIGVTVEHRKIGGRSSEPLPDDRSTPGASRGMRGRRHRRDYQRTGGGRPDEGTAPYSAQTGISTRGELPARAGRSQDFPSSARYSKIGISTEMPLTCS